MSSMEVSVAAWPKRVRRAWPVMEPEGAEAESIVGERLLVEESVVTGTQYSPGLEL